MLLPVVLMEVGRATSSMMKVRATKKNYIRHKMRLVYFMMRQKLLLRIEGCVRSYQSYDNGGGPVVMKI